MSEKTYARIYCAEIMADKAAHEVYFAWSDTETGTPLDRDLKELHMALADVAYRLEMLRLTMERTDKKR